MVTREGVLLSNMWQTKMTELQQNNIEKNDNDLVAEYLAGDEVAFESLLRKYLSQVYNFLYQIVRDREVAEDLTQDTFLKVWKNLKRFDQKKNFRTWLYTIAKNTAFDWLKKKKSLAFSQFQDEEGRNLLENIADEQALPDEILERKDLAQELGEKLKEIPELYRTILLLHYREDFSLHEIAEIFGEPYNTVKSRHRRALAELKKIFER